MIFSLEWITMAFFFIPLLLGAIIGFMVLDARKGWVVAPALLVTTTVVSLFFGWTEGWVVLLLLWLPVIGVHVLVRHGSSFFVGLCASIALVVVTLLIGALWGQWYTDKTIVDAISDHLVHALSQESLFSRIWMEWLTMLPIQGGMFETINEAMAYRESLLLLPQVEAALVVKPYLVEWIQANLGVWLLSGSVLAGAPMWCAPLYGVNRIYRRTKEFPPKIRGFGAPPPFSAWRIRAWVGMPAALLMGIGALLRENSEQPIQMAASVMVYIGTIVFAVGGASFISFWLHTKKVPTIIHWLILLPASLFLATILACLGILDSILQFRRYIFWKDMITRKNRSPEEVLRMMQDEDNDDEEDTRL